MLGLDDLDPGSAPHDLLTATLPTGTRRLPTPVAAPLPADGGPGPTRIDPVSAGPAAATSGPTGDRALPPGPGMPARVFWLGVPVGEAPVAPAQSGSDAGQPGDGRPGRESRPAEPGVRVSVFGHSASRDSPHACCVALVFDLA